MKHKYIMTAFLLNISNDGITPKSLKAAKANEDFACLDVEHDDIIVDDISACEIVPSGAMRTTPRCSSPL